jgi:hypothetical protein
LLPKIRKSFKLIYFRWLLLIGTKNKVKLFSVAAAENKSAAKNKRNAAKNNKILFLAVLPLKIKMSYFCWFFLAAKYKETPNLVYLWWFLLISHQKKLKLILAMNAKNKPYF